MLGGSLIHDSILLMLPQSTKIVPCSSTAVSILSPGTRNADVNSTVAIASEGKLVLVTDTKTHVGLRVFRQTCVEGEDVGTVNVLSKGTELLYFEPTQTVVRQGRLILT